MSAATTCHRQPQPAAHSPPPPRARPGLALLTLPLGADVYKYCSPTRSALQSGRNPYHVNPLNAAPVIANLSDPVSGFAAIPRNMTGIATKMSAAGYKTHSFGKVGPAQ